ncbi:MAG: efflux RND transporter periplasmic adaptor subunit [Candidatus Latescibacteria bacterium]|nr:efflux RND transporter periplasmic adaptor subunit [Candidatus Latescibacterota bacterium]
MGERTMDVRKLAPWVSASVLVLACICLGGCGSEDAEGKKKDGTQADSTKVDSTQVDSAKAAEAEEKKKKKVPEGVPVKVDSVAQGEISSYLLYSATVEAEETVDVYSRATGLVKRVLTEEGDRVRAGQVLVQLVDDELRLRAEEAEVDHRKLESQFKRKEEMFSRKLLAKEAFERLQYDMEQARIRWERAKLALDHASVRSPVDGVVSERMVKLGDRIGPSAKLFSLVDLDNLIAHVHVPGREMQNLQKGQPAVVTSDFLPDSTFEAEIIRVSPVVDPGSGTFKVTLGVDNGKGQLRPGMFVNSHIVTATHAESVLAPKRAVVYDDGLPFVFIVKDSTAHKVQLKVGFEDSENLEVLSGIQKGDLIVVVGQNGLKDKAKVRVIEGEGLRIPAKPDTTSKADQAS